MLFRDRLDAALKLIPFLEKYKNKQGIVLAVPRGGVPIGYLIAKSLNLPLELLLTKKIGYPGNEELAIGAVSMEDYSIDEKHNIPESYIKKEVKKIREILRVRYLKFMGENHKPPAVENKILIIVDDGIATGNTILSGIKMMRKKNPEKIVVAVPVAPSQIAEKIRKNVDEYICLYSPDDFIGVGQFYKDFSEVNDDEVSELLKELNHTDVIA